MKTEQFDRQRSVAAVAQFVALVHAREKGRRDAEREAREALARLGVNVRFQKAVANAR